MDRFIARWAILVAVLAVVVLGGRSNAMTIAVTECGQVVPAGKTGELVANLTCPVKVEIGTMAERSAVYLEAGARLRLNGYTLAGVNNAVGCPKKCYIEGPGVIRDFPVGISSTGTAQVRDVEFANNGQSAIYQMGGSVLRLTNVVIRDADGLGAITAALVRAKGLIIDGCWVGIWGGRLIGSDIAIQNCGSRGIYNSQIRATRLNVTDNAGIGIASHRVSLRDSIVTGNETGGQGVDIQTDRAPRLRNSICGRSQQGEGGTSFGVCQND